MKARVLHDVIPQGGNVKHGATLVGDAEMIPQDMLAEAGKISLGKPGAFGTSHGSNT